MSGGSMDYLYTKVRDATFEEDTPLRRAFRTHLNLVAEALHEIEWVDSADKIDGDEEEAIRKVLGDKGEALHIAQELRINIAIGESLVKKLEAGTE